MGDVLKFTGRRVSGPRSAICGACGRVVSGMPDGSDACPSCGEKALLELSPREFALVMCIYVGVVRVFKTELAAAVGAAEKAAPSPSGEGA